MSACTRTEPDGATQVGGSAQTPAWQVCTPVHTSPSSQSVPSGRGVWTQPAIGSQASSVQTSPSSQSIAGRHVGSSEAKSPAWPRWARSTAGEATVMNTYGFVCEPVAWQIPRRST